MLNRPAAAIFVLVAASLWSVVGLSTPGDKPAKRVDVMRELAQSRPPSWIKWLGWATDGTRIAWRQGGHGSGNVPGRPIWIARLNTQGATVDRHYRRKQLQKALDSRGIRRRPQAMIEEVGPADVLIRTKAGELIAVAVRGTPPVLAVLRKVADNYVVVARRQVMGPVTTLRVNAAEQPAGRLMAIVAHTGRGQRRQATLLIIPLQPLAQVPAIALAKPATITRAPAKIVPKTATKRANPTSVPPRTRPKPAPR